jgi:phage protein U
MFAAFGSISFQVLSSPTKLEQLQKYHYGKLEVIGAPPILQWIYDDLEEIKLEIYLHFYWCNPSKVLAALQTLATTHQAQTFVFGNGLNIGSYVIDSMEVKHVWMADNGNPLALTIELSLMQYVASGSVLTPSQIGASPAPPGLTTSKSLAPGAVIVQAPATANPSSIPARTPYTSIPLSTVARGY